MNDRAQVAAACTSGGIVIGTGNPHKVEEIRAIFAEGPLAAVPLLGLRDIPGGPWVEPVEHGNTFEDNATIKALGYARQTGRLCLADDSGLTIDALGGRPGVISSHYYADGAERGHSRPERDALNNERVTRELRGVPVEQRSARFVCVMVLADATGVRAIGRGTFEGRIGVPPEVPRGRDGFGYDPLFLVAAAPVPYSVTSAELTPAEKNRLSHRGMAAKDLAAKLCEH